VGEVAGQQFGADVDLFSGTKGPTSETYKDAKKHLFGGADKAVEDAENLRQRTNTFRLIGRKHGIPSGVTDSMAENSDITPDKLMQLAKEDGGKALTESEREAEAYPGGKKEYYRKRAIKRVDEATKTSGFTEGDKNLLFTTFGVKSYGDLANEVTDALSSPKSRPGAMKFLKAILSMPKERGDRLAAFFLNSGLVTQDDFREAAGQKPPEEIDMGPVDALRNWVGNKIRP